MTRAAFVEPLAFRRQHERPLRAVDELHAHALFQVVDDLAGVRLRHAVGLGRARKAAQVDDVAEDFEESKVHIGLRNDLQVGDAGRTGPIFSCDDRELPRASTPSVTRQVRQFEFHPTQAMRRKKYAAFQSII